MEAVRVPEGCHELLQGAPEELCDRVRRAAHPAMVAMGAITAMAINQMPRLTAEDGPTHGR